MEPTAESQESNSWYMRDIHGDRWPQTKSGVITAYLVGIAGGGLLLWGVIVLANWLAH